MGSDSFQYEVSDGREARGAQVSVQVVEQVQQTSALVFPVTVDTGSSSYLSGTYVGVGLLNPGSSYETVNVADRSTGGKSLSEVQLADQLPPKGQTAFLTGELPSLSPDSVSLSISASSSSLQGFFMVGDFASRRMDGVGAQLDASTTLYFPVVHESSVDSTLIQLLNPSATETTWISLELHQPNGKIAAQVNAAMAAGGSFMGTIKEIFGIKGSMSEGFVAAKATRAISGYEVVASQKSLTSGSGRKPASSQRLLAPHFFADSDGGTSVVRILNAGTQTAIATINVRNDAGETMARKEVTLPASQLTVVTAAQILNLGNKKPSQLLTGSIDVSIPQATPVVASLEFTGFAGKSSTAAPMVESGYEDTVFPQVAQTTDGSIYTGLAILNPNETSVNVTVEAYTADGRLARRKSFDLDPRARKIDLLSGASFFGPDFAQTKGHIRVRSTGKVVSYAIFGDARGEYLSTIEGQQAK